jgi:hypothetical protein
MWSKTKGLMYRRSALLVLISALKLTLASPLMAQDGPVSTTAPNSMTVHTWFIILAVGAFLVWSISYSLQLHKEALRRKTSREGLLQMKNRLLDDITRLQAEHAGGKLTDDRYRYDLNRMKQQLSRVLQELGVKRDSAAGR